MNETEKAKAPEVVAREWLRGDGRLDPASGRAVASLADLIQGEREAAFLRGLEAAAPIIEWKSSAEVRASVDAARRAAVEGEGADGE